MIEVDERLVVIELRSLMERLEEEGRRYLGVDDATSDQYLHDALYVREAIKILSGQK
jgi:hypothetical protein